MYTCANCSVLSCSQPDHAHMPHNCPMHHQDVLDAAWDATLAEQDFYVASSEIEGMGYGQWPRLREVVEFCRRMGYTKVGLAFCRGLRSEAKVVSRILEGHGLTVVSVICKAGGIPKEQIGVPKEHKVHPDHFEPMCNPIAQAQLLNQQGTQFNVAVGLCVGHDSLFFKYSQAPVTVLVAKDRVLAHNPAGAIYCAEEYFRGRLASEEG